MNQQQDINWALARMLRQARRAAGMTQVELAEATGLSEQYISKMERGASGVSLKVLFALSRILGLPVAEFVRRIEEDVRCHPLPLVPKRGKPAKASELETMTGNEEGAE